MKSTMEINLCFKISIKDVVMGQTCFDGNISHTQRFQQEHEELNTFQ